MKLPKGEETLPIIEIEGKMLTLDELKKLYPEIYDKLVSPTIAYEVKIRDALLLERFRMRLTQKRVPTIHRWGYPQTLTPEEQLAYMEARDPVGLELINAERGLLEEELAMLKR